MNGDDVDNDEAFKYTDKEYGGYAIYAIQYFEEDIEIQQKEQPSVECDIAHLNDEEGMRVFYKNEDGTEAYLGKATRESQGTTAISE